MITISYAITVCNELSELVRLIEKIKPYVREEDEIIVQIDEHNTTEDVKGYLNHINIQFELEKISFHRIFHSLKGDFASFKNHLLDHCKKDYIFFIDADEYPSEMVLQFLPMVLENNINIDVFLLPRVNKVEGITQEHINKWNWQLDEENRINWPDYQMRIVRNANNIKWSGKVHERIEGFKTISIFPKDNEDWVLYHPKNIERQERQNNFYSTL